MGLGPTCVIDGCGEPYGVGGPDGFDLCRRHYDELEEWNRAEAEQLEREDGVDQMKHTCPRRMSDFGPWQREEHLDGWRYRGMAGVRLRDRMKHCDFCGSLHPDKFMELVREGWIVGPTDKNYKAYLARPFTPEQVAERKERWLTAEHGIAQAIRRLGKEGGKSEEQIAADLEEQWALEGGINEGAQETKFYFQHLSEDQRREFVELLNAGTMRIGYPGHFYVRPFFTRPVT